MFNRALILSVSAGAGHVSCAKAVENAFLITGAAKEVKNVDVLKFSTETFAHINRDLYLKFSNEAPSLLGPLYDLTDIPYKKRGFIEALERAHTSRLIEVIDEYRPDIIVNTHFLPARIHGWRRKKGRTNIPQAVIVTDMDVHAFWLYDNIDRYYVALPETKVHMRELGISEDKITVSGIAVDPVFAQVKDKREMRLKHGLEPDRTTIMLSAGGYGVGKIEELVNNLLRLNHPVQIAVMCARNQELKQKLESNAASLSSNRVLIKPVGFTADMDEYMAASDLMVGKPGGLTTSEALAKGLPMVIVDPIGGQEFRNSNHLLEKGAAIKGNNKPALAWKIDDLLADPARLANLQENARRLGRPRAAMEIVESLSSLPSPAPLSKTRLGKKYGWR